MNILLVVKNYYPSIGGTQILFQNLAERFVQNYNDSVEVYTTDSFFGPEKKYKRIKKKEEIINGVPIKRFPYNKWHLSTLKLYKRIFYRCFKRVPNHVSAYLSGPWSPALSRAIEASKADIILAGTAPYLFMLYPLKHTSAGRKPFAFQGAIHFRENSTEQILPVSVLDAIRKSNCYFANTLFEKKCLIDLGINPNKIIVTGVGVDILKYSNGDRSFYRNEFNLREDDILIGCIGRIEEAKSIEVLLEAFERCYRNQNNISLLVAGRSNDTYIEKLRTIIKNIEHSFSSVQIKIFKDISEAQKIDLFNAIDIFVLPSVSESFGIVFLEAWSCKKPVVGIANAAIREVITNNQDGLLALPGNSTDLANKITTLCSDKDLRHRLGNNGYHKTSENFTWDHVASKYRAGLQMAIQDANKLSA